MLSEMIDTIEQLARQAMAPREAKIGEYCILPNGTVHDLTSIAERALAQPRRLTASLAFSDIPSFVAYWKKFVNTESVLFHDGEKSVAAVLDYHGSDAPKWCAHKATLTLKDTIEWATWKAWDGKPRAQAEFALFIEDNAPDIINPQSAEMIEVARNLQARSEMQFASSVRLQNGQTQLKFTEATTATVGKEQVEVPERFTIKIGIFESLPAVTIEARLRYRIKEGKLLMWYDLWRSHKAVDEAFNAALEQITEDCERQPLYGSLLK